MDLLAALIKTHVNVAYASLGKMKTAEGSVDITEGETPVLTRKTIPATLDQDQLRAYAEGTSTAIKQYMMTMAQIVAPTTGGKSAVLMP